MKVALLTGAFKNAGDYLITERTESLLMYRYPMAKIIKYERNCSLDPSLKSLNENDVVVFAGGPGWISHMYPEKFPLTTKLNEIVPPMFVLGMGCKTKNENVKRISFTSQSKQLIERLYSDGFHLGCRDNLTYQVLERSGLKRTIMTGCPAWYDLNYIHQNNLFTAPEEGKINKIAISDPGNVANIQLAANIVALCKKRYKPDVIVFVFHRGWNKDKYTSDDVASKQQVLRDWLVDNNVKVVDASYSSKGFTEYDDSDLHIGFRVHAHIYCLSRKLPSFLIEEDGRGFGVNETLGLAHIRPRKVDSFLRTVWQFQKVTFEYLSTISRDSQDTFSLLDDAIESEITSGWEKHHRAFATMEKTFEVMCSHIDEISVVAN